ncbi:MAG: DUF5107 domain-containing protein [Phycisphaerae bacterium]
MSLSKLLLPEAPEYESGPVKAWPQPVEIDTYLPSIPDKNPLFLERRVYQGSSGRVYPLPVIDRIAGSPVVRTWQALHLENEYIRLMVLPEIGGRIHIGLDKTSGYDFFYRQNVIKPALVGLAGPWVSGGVEFNWPQHHRPATFMPVEWYIEKESDGSRTLWLSDHDPLSRLKGMHGVRLRPGSSLVELRVRLFNRTLTPQTFLWWANIGVHVHERYQSFFPPDVHYVADHARRAISEFPLCRGVYYGVDYGARAQHGIPADQMPTIMAPTGDYAPNDLSWYANIPVPTSYMAIGSKYDFCGGYDHKADAGLVSVADHHIAPGKKQWTWGNSEFGHMWNRHLTDNDGPYIELMTGVFTDNQPDFSFLAPGETRVFSQYWYPIKKIGPPIAAGKSAAVALTATSKGLKIGLAVVKAYTGLRVELRSGDKCLLDTPVEVNPDKPYLGHIDAGGHFTRLPWTLRIVESSGEVLLACASSPDTSISPPPVAIEPPEPQNVLTNDELCVTGLHLDQYRHATRYPENYWHEALNRDPGDSRCLTAIGLWHFKRGEFEQAIKHLRRAISRLTQLNSNPYDGEPYYHLGLALVFLDKPDDAYDAFYKAAWNRNWQGPAYLELARIAAVRRNWHLALDHCVQSLRSEPENIGTLCLKTLVLRELTRSAEAESCLRHCLSLDPLSPLARYLADKTAQFPLQIALDAAHELARAGFFDLALELLNRSGLDWEYGAETIRLYTCAYFHQRAGREAQAKSGFATAAAAPADWCFPSRLEEIPVLQAAIANGPHDGLARLLLGQLYYDRRRYIEATELWEQAAVLRPCDSLVWRNLGVARFNVNGDAAGAGNAYKTARKCNPDDARILYESDQLAKVTRVSVAERLDDLHRNVHLVTRRDDLSLELAALLNQSGRPEKALEMMLTRQFQPWEGGEGLILEEFLRAKVISGIVHLIKGQTNSAMDDFRSTLRPPENLGETWHPLANRSEVYYWLGEASVAVENLADANKWWTKAAESEGDFQQMAVTPYSEKTLFQILSLQRLNRRAEAMDLIDKLRLHSEELLKHPATIDYFATSLPTLLLFNTDLQAGQAIKARFLMSQVHLAAGDFNAARAVAEDILQQNPSHSGAADMRYILQYLGSAPNAGVRRHKRSATMALRSQGESADE